MTLPNFSCCLWDQAPRPGIRPGPLLSRVCISRHWTSRGVPGLCCLPLSSVPRNQDRCVWDVGGKGLTCDPFPVCLLGRLSLQLHQHTFITVLTPIRQFYVLKKVDRRCWLWGVRSGGESEPWSLEGGSGLGQPQPPPIPCHCTTASACLFVPFFLSLLGLTFSSWQISA